MEEPNSRLSQTCETFIRSRVNTLWKLDLLLYLRDREDAKDVDEISADLYISKDAVVQACKDLREAGLLLEVEHGFRYHKTNPEASAVDEAAEAYKSRKTALIGQIYRWQ